MRLPTKAIGTVKAAQYNELVDIVTALVRGGAGAIRVGPGLQMKQGATDTDRWTYDWQEAEQTGTGYPMTAKAGGATGTAYNGAENPDVPPSPVSSFEQNQYSSAVIVGEAATFRIRTIVFVGTAS